MPSRVAPIIICTLPSKGEEESECRLGEDRSTSGNSKEVDLAILGWSGKVDGRLLEVLIIFGQVNLKLEWR
jgi:hypothetical protein